MVNSKITWQLFWWEKEALPQMPDSVCSRCSKTLHKQDLAEMYAQCANADTGWVTKQAAGISMSMDACRKVLCRTQGMAAISKQSYSRQCCCYRRCTSQPLMMLGNIEC